MTAEKRREFRFSPKSPLFPWRSQRGSPQRSGLASLAEGRLGFFLPGTHDLAEVDLTGVARPEVAAAAARFVGRLPAGSTLELRSDGEKVVAVTEAQG
mgnify:CR=1 FL=1